MKISSSWMEGLLHQIHRHILVILLGLYLLAGVLPQAGLGLRALQIGILKPAGQTPFVISLPVLMLFFLLFNAGLNVKAAELLGLIRRPGLLLGGLAVNLLLPVGFIVLMSRFSSHWHNADEAQQILMGLAMVGAMPIAGASSAWAQSVEGDLALSLGLVVFSTLASPFSTPWVLDTVSRLSTGDYAEDLHELARHGTETFLMVSVILPSLLGIGCHRLLGEKRLHSARPWLKLLNQANMFLLTYCNASLVLPRILHRPDWDFLALAGVLAGCLCLLAFLSGWLLPHLSKAGRPQKAAMMYGLGMSNNGTGLVLSSIMLPDHPTVMLPIIFYNLIQQIFAGLVTRFVDADRES